MSSTDRPRVTAERLSDADHLAERTHFMSIGTGATTARRPGEEDDFLPNIATTASSGPVGPSGHKLSRHSYGPSSPCSPHSPRVGEVWRTGQTAVYGGWFRPSPKPKQHGQQ
ncbi:unconventional myosin-X [Chlorella sorokiniana]|jgi:hypothetical protein|uniref:Unconventional myosin-X n=1 Tax=Chlorella sorokiniana TaxID=3076 RepID=A0A2P6TR49_CHLSO|nr:unconventional myosin-X [Chlorella sorokiniana]|eukprot:PRW56531.1 unconventional myosin-X [Chlorella sorokiniana]